MSAAGDLMLGAARIRAEAECWNGKHPIAGDLRRAEALEVRAREPLPERITELGAGGELVPHGRQGLQAAEFRSTVAKPDYVAADASRDRLDLLHQCGALELGLDMADSVNAQNSVEMMLAYQLATSHQSAMKLTAQLNRQIERMNVIADGPRQLANVEAARLTGSITRLMMAFQGGVTTLQRLRFGGRQVVTVQHVNVEAGGQAIVAHGVSTGGSAGRMTRGEIKDGS